jgi:hypothetical protein
MRWHYEIGATEDQGVIIEFDPGQPRKLNLEDLCSPCTKEKCTKYV